MLIDQRDHAQESEIGESVNFIRIEAVVDRELFGIQTNVAEAHDSLVGADELLVDGVYLVLPLIVKLNVVAIDENARAVLQDDLQRALHDNQVAFVVVVRFVNVELVAAALVGWHLVNLAILQTVFGHFGIDGLAAFEQGDIDISACAFLE